ncbi:hypothetical protein G5I_04264 [Acromyrmex echinatior]|uniref:Uncharacterized protein n=1 Tax=Acromyrmex echinatior TaxID=103372 RepID=F4WF57_ACREC|nr:hypothetical protein G5I_04264 [Acromyrmex echinatior]
MGSTVDEREREKRQRDIERGVGDEQSEREQSGERESDCIVVTWSHSNPRYSPSRKSAGRNISFYAEATAASRRGEARRAGRGGGRRGKARQDELKRAEARRGEVRRDEASLNENPWVLLSTLRNVPHAPLCPTLVKTAQRCEPKHNDHPYFLPGTRYPTIPRFHK